MYEKFSKYISYTVPGFPLGKAGPPAETPTPVPTGTTTGPAPPGVAPGTAAPVPVIPTPVRQKKLMH